jgi:hypothetical protein
MTAMAGRVMPPAVQFLRVSILQDAEQAELFTFRT